MMDKRLSNNLLTYWNKIKENQDMMPHIDSLDVKYPLINEIWNKCLLATITDLTSMTLKYEYIGTEIIELFGNNCDTISKDRSNLSYNPMTKILGKTRAINFIKKPRAITDNGTYELMDGKIIKYRSCLLPFGKNNELDHLVIGITWKLSTYE
ncbi:hypothetical protein SZ25_00127 [Candidatus Arcanobacter lacustris]|uniref:PAS domain-containing protein n=1 Tax=Candidatus Arcanibacter lacustris TaxID=1607817 RepID=A0A0F5MPP1_9RICK|nr:hypothetical protein SZ25_00127 [Candidatus Arcanobacter lacustris]